MKNESIKPLLSAFGKWMSSEATLNLQNQVRTETEELAVKTHVETFLMTVIDSVGLRLSRSQVTDQKCQATNPKLEDPAIRTGTQRWTPGTSMKTSSWAA